MSDYALSYIAANGSTYVLNDSVNSWLRENGMRGFGVERMTIASERRPYWDGVTIIGEPYTPAREMEIALEIIHTSYANWLAFNRTLARNVNPYRDTDTLGTLRVVTPDGLTRDIRCWMVAWPDPTMAGPVDGIIVPVFWAPEPFFYDPTMQTESLLVAGPGGFRFPITFPITFPTSQGLEFPVTFPIVFGSSLVDTHLYPVNLGDVAVWPTIRVTAPGKDIYLENETTDKKLELTAGTGLELATGDYVDIDMEEATINWYDASEGATINVIEKMSNGSEFWPLAVGENVIRVRLIRANSGTVTISYYNKYISV